MLKILKLRYEFANSVSLGLHHDIPTITFRGAFGYALAQVIARYAGIPGLENQVALYKKIFMPEREEDESGGKDLSRPFILRGYYSRPDNRSFILDVHLFGRATEYEGFFDNVIEVMSYMGLGIDNQICHFTKVKSWEVEIPDPQPGEFLSVRFITPCARIKYHGEIYYDEIPFPALFARLADRVDELNRLYGDGRDSITEGGIGELKRLSETVCYKKVSGGRYAAMRTSGRTHQTMRLDGFTGEMAYHGDFEPFREYLRYLPYINLGRFNVFGCGWCEMEYLYDQNNIENEQRKE